MEIEKHKGCSRGYHRSSKAWYAKFNNTDRIRVQFGMYAKDGSTSGEMSVEWVLLDNNLCARLKSFEDGWSALALFTDLIQKLGEVDNQLIQEVDFCKILDDCGFKDLTSYTEYDEK